MERGSIGLKCIFHLLKYLARGHRRDMPGQWSSCARAQVLEWPTIAFWLASCLQYGFAWRGMSYARMRWRYAKVPFICTPLNWFADRQSEDF
ncbi:hypothetical protein WIW49_08660 [Xanthomonas euroxanthea]